MRKFTSGFSLIELMVAMTIGLMVLTVLGTVFSRTSSGRGDLDRVSRLLETSRYAADLIGEDIRHAGFYGTFMPPSDTVFDDASPCAWSLTDAKALGWQPVGESASTAPHYPAPLQGWDVAPGATVSALKDCLPDPQVPGTDVLVIRRASSAPVSPTQVAAVPAVYVQHTQCVDEKVNERPNVIVSSDSKAFTLKTASCGSDLAEIRRYFVRIYYVASCNDCAAGDGVPTLKRVEFTNSAKPQATTIAEGVQDLQFEYALDDLDAAGKAPPDGVLDGVPEKMVTLPTTWANVVSIRMHALMRSSEPGLSADTTPTRFNLGPDREDVSCPDRYRCRLMTSTFRLNNVAGRREK